jgi:hypothetical protein
LDSIVINLKISLCLKELDEIINNYKNDKNIISFDKIPINNLKKSLLYLGEFRKANHQLNYKILKNTDSRQKINNYIKNLFKNSEIFKIKFHCSSILSICIEKRFRPCGEFDELTFSNLDKIIHELENKIKLKEKKNSNQTFSDLENGVNNMSFNSNQTTNTPYLEIETINEVKKNSNKIDLVLQS